MSQVLRMMRWGEMSAAERASLFERGLEHTISDELRAQIGELILDVRDARRRGRVPRRWPASTASTSSPTACAVTERRVRRRRPGSSTRRCAAAIGDMIDHIRRFNDELLSRRGDWSFESEPGLTVGEKVTPIASVGLFCPSGKASYPSVLAQLGTPAVVAGVPTHRRRRAAEAGRRRSGRSGRARRRRRARAARRVPRQRAGRRSPRWRSAPSGSRRSSRWSARAAAGHLRPGRDAALRHGDDDGARPDRERGDRRRRPPIRAPRRRPADRGRARHRLVHAARTPPAGAGAGATDVELAAPARRPAAGAPEAAPASLGVNGGCVLVDDLARPPRSPTPSPPSTCRSPSPLRTRTP